MTTKSAVEGANGQNGSQTSNYTSDDDDSTPPPLSAKDILPWNLKNTYIVITGDQSEPQQPVMVALADYLGKELNEPDAGNSIVLRAPHYKAAIEMAVAHSPFSVVSYITEDRRTEVRKLQGIIDENPLATKLSGVFNPLSAVPGGHSFTEESFPDIAERVLRITQEVMTSRQSLTPKSKDSVVSGMEETFSREAKELRSPGFSGTTTVVLKVGGSIADLLDSTRFTGGYEIYANLVRAIADVASEYNFVFTVGGGPVAETASAMDSRIGPQSTTLRANHRQQAENLLNELRQYVPQIKERLRERLRDDTYSVELIDQGQMSKLMPFAKMNSTQGLRSPYDMIVISGPQGVMSDKSIPPESSDTLTIVSAGYLEVPNLIFVKDTDGIFARDPNLSDKDAKRKLPPEFHQYIGGDNNRYYKRMYASDVGKEISRVGLIGNQHLVGDDDLRVLQEQLGVGSIQIVSGRRPDQIKAAISGEPVGSFVLNDVCYTGCK